MNFSKFMDALLSNLWFSKLLRWFFPPLQLEVTVVSTLIGERDVEYVLTLHAGLPFCTKKSVLLLFIRIQKQAIFSLTKTLLRRFRILVFQVSDCDFCDLYFLSIYYSATRRRFFKEQWPYAIRNLIQVKEHQLTKQHYLSLLCTNRNLSKLYWYSQISTKGASFVLFFYFHWKFIFGSWRRNVKGHTGNAPIGVFSSWKRR